MPREVTMFVLTKNTSIPATRPTGEMVRSILSDEYHCTIIRRGDSILVYLRYVGSRYLSKVQELRCTINLENVRYEGSTWRFNGDLMSLISSQSHLRSR